MEAAMSVAPAITLMERTASLLDTFNQAAITAFSAMQSSRRWWCGAADRSNAYSGSNFPISQDSLTFVKLT
ncbi:hypothetical protein, partial [Mycobacterium sp.]|uniref:hypothetical protein n=1 Tax=Mycobacterium sp. TaxID=1785 RepID=UPI003C75337F